ncbi:glycosyltransferase family 39 protein [Bacteroidales bacterium AH-315-I05]|nr:glycosyltransferase family 39 protein [Bacteroidales bacterium AH-315-I05]
MKIQLLKKIPTYLKWVFAIAFLLRTIWFIVVFIKNPEGFFLYDSWGYLRLAENIYEHGIFSQGTVESGTLIPDLQRTPLYPLFLLLSSYLYLGAYGVIALQLILSSVSCCIVAFLAKTIFGNEKIGLLAGILLALDFPSIYFANTILTETLFTFLFLLAISDFVFFIKRQKNKYLLGCGIWLGLGILCRPAAAYFPVLLILILLMLKPVKNNAVSIVTLIATTLLVVSPWLARNYFVFGSSILSNVGEINLLFHTTASIRSIEESKSMFEIEAEYRKISEEQYNWHKPEDAIRFAEFSRKETIRVISEYPARFTKNYAGSFMFFFIKPLRSYIDQQLGLQHGYDPIASLTDERYSSLIKKTLDKSSLLTVCIVAYQSVHLLLLLGVSTLLIIRNFREKNKWIWLFGAIILYFAALSSITEVDARMRVPVVPYLAILAAIGLANFPKIWLIKK